MGLCNSISLMLWKILLLEPHQIIDVAYYSELFSLAVYPVSVINTLEVSLLGWH